tara:strand:+ start:1542 stop:2372 length:831 start_codon:yes stop_codon:yes gene_type:complete
MVSFSEFDMSGKVTVVTGAAGLLGKYHCEALLEAGSIVIATDLNKFLFETDEFKKLKDQYLDKLYYYCLDVSIMEKCFALCDRLNEKKLFVTNLVNNAAINPSVGNTGLKSLGRLKDFNNKEFQTEVSVGLSGAINCSAAFGSWMEKIGGGNILNIASDLSVIAPSQFLYTNDEEDFEKQPKKPISYSCIKHGLIGVTKYLATYFDSGLIRCNALSPGGVQTDQSVEFIKKMESLIPMKRMAKADEYKGAIKFLCSDASKYMNGQNIVIDGGRSIW